MKIILTVFLFILNWSCNNGQYIYPKIISEKNLQWQYNLAKFETYRLSTNFNCTCKGFYFDKHERNDTLNILSLDLRLDTLLVNNDTLSFLFSFFTVNNDRVYHITDIYDDCIQCIGIQIVNNNLYKAMFLEDGYVLYDNNVNIKNDSKFVQCIKLAKDQTINNWLKRYIEQQ